MNDGMTLGYKGSLGAIFTERKVPSEKRTLMNTIAISYFLRMFFAPLADKYFSTWLGKRKTYIVPCKIFAICVYSFFSFYIEDWVANNRIVVLATYFFLVQLVMILENNALQGYRMDFFGRKDSNFASSAASIGLLLGSCIGL